MSQPPISTIATRSPSGAVRNFAAAVINPANAWYPPPAPPPLIATPFAPCALAKFRASSGSVSP
ncbi:MAG: hypothetical protein WDN03_00365 [Rhizomicrobium sp.]